MAYLSSDLVTAVKRGAAVPTAQNTFQDSDFYSMLDEAIRSKLLPLVLDTMEEFYVRTLDHNITADQARYAIPTRAVAGALRDVEVVNSANDDDRFPLQRISREDLYAVLSGVPTVSVQKNGFYPEGNNIILYPTPTVTQNILRMSYYCRPNTVVATSACGKISSINTATRQITLASIPSTFSTSTPLDFVKANPHFECTAIDQTPTNVAGTVLTFGSTLPTDLAVGDYVCLAGESCVVQVPAELQPLLVQYVVVRILSAQADSDAYKMAVTELEVLENNARNLISPRIAGKAQRATNSRSISRFV